jgi:hypothetical protein
MAMLALLVMTLKTTDWGTCHMMFIQSFLEIHQFVTKLFGERTEQADMWT